MNRVIVVSSAVRIYDIFLVGSHVSLALPPSPHACPTSSALKLNLMYVTSPAGWVRAASIRAQLLSGILTDPMKS